VAVVLKQRVSFVQWS